MKFVTVLGLLLLAGCYNHSVDTFVEWCEQISGVNLQKKYQPFWAVLFSVSFDGDAIRDDFVKFLNDSHSRRFRVAFLGWRGARVLIFTS